MVRVHLDPPRFVCGTQWGFSSSGRAPALQAGGERFDPVNLHQFSLVLWCELNVCDRSVSRQLKSGKRIYIQAVAFEYWFLTDKLFFKNLEEVKKVIHASESIAQAMGERV